TTIADAPSSIAQTHWDVAPGTYIRADGHIVHLVGREHFWGCPSSHEKPSTLTSVVCHSGETTID
ncbi:hypothetical protein CC86DRAFT_268279, partial [Ophiobolus disseminans]